MQKNPQSPPAAMAGYPTEAKANPTPAAATKYEPVFLFKKINQALKKNKPMQAILFAAILIGHAIVTNK